jgi:hypothetical protein
VCDKEVSIQLLPINPNQGGFHELNTKTPFLTGEVGFRHPYETVTVWKTEMLASDLFFARIKNLGKRSLTGVKAPLHKGIIPRSERVQSRFSKLPGSYL